MRPTDLIRSLNNIQIQTRLQNHSNGQRHMDDVTKSQKWNNTLEWKSYPRTIDDLGQYLGIEKFCERQPNTNSGKDGG